MLLQQPTPAGPRYFVGLDVHRDTSASCVYDATLRCVCEEREFPPKHLSRSVSSLRSSYGDFRCCYEAPFRGTAVYDALGVDCAIIAPGSIARRHGD